jgi:hypothetical protein
MDRNRLDMSELLNYRRRRLKYTSKALLSLLSLLSLLIHLIYVAIHYLALRLDI